MPQPWRPVPTVVGSSDVGFATATTPSRRHGSTRRKGSSLCLPALLVGLVLGAVIGAVMVKVFDPAQQPVETRTQTIPLVMGAAAAPITFSTAAPVSLSGIPSTTSAETSKVTRAPATAKSTATTTTQSKAATTLAKPGAGFDPARCAAWMCPDGFKMKKNVGHLRLKVGQPRLQNCCEPV
mmetsp:Transcript_59541/g.137645  ORF Transcript_59541/g.137645 Transcript_59541/m.137645 type:complete len:181 (+) Transcript_59541:14-556(+)